ncbi:Na+/H+ antiporter NhaC family protein [Halobacillus rhizosphaerae]|uniref:Na+/H+ antiporter NhaC family protein n=1 Tax=Halobacillus rhizosphaerae TaxID=3064889 RepID=UPI00398A7B73
MAHWESVVPFMIIIIIALWTKQVIPGLFIGLMAASYLVQGSLLGGIEKMADYLVTNLAKPPKLQVIGFLYIFTGIIHLSKKTGGISGFIELVSKKIHSKKQAVLLVWLTLIGTFISPNLRIVTVAPIMKSLQGPLQLNKERISFVIEASALPVIALIPLATAFIGYMTSTIDLALDNAAIPGDAYIYFLKSIPFNFFSIVTIVLAILYSIYPHPAIFNRYMDHKEDRKEDSSEKDSEDSASGQIEANVFNLVIPLSLALGLSVLLSWLDGYQKSSSFSQAFVKADVTHSMFVAILITLLVTFVMLLIEKHDMKGLLDDFFEGGNKLIPAFFLFALVWALSSAAKDLGLAEFVTSTLGEIPASIIPPVTFVLGSLIAYFIGSAWGSWGLLMPVGVSLASASSLPLEVFIGIVFASGTLGGLISPLSGTTVTMAKIMELDTILYAKYKFKHVIVPFVLSAVLYWGFAYFDKFYH